MFKLNPHLYRISRHVCLAQRLLVGQQQLMKAAAAAAPSHFLAAHR
jgi:hypothetical protein